MFSRKPMKLNNKTVTEELYLNVSGSSVFPPEFLVISSSLAETMASIDFLSNHPQAPTSFGHSLSFWLSQSDVRSEVNFPYRYMTIWCRFG